MNKIKHGALRTPDPEKTAAFYKEVFGLKEVGKAGNSGLYLTDGHINMAILKTVEGEDREDFYGLDHFGFQVDDVEETCRKLREHGSEELATHAPPPTESEGKSYYELKYRGPDNQIVDVSGSGWIGTD